MRTISAAAVLALVLSACTGSGTSSSNDLSPRNVPETFDADLIVTVLGQDQIRSLDDHPYSVAADVDLDGSHPVVVANINDDPKAFPLGVMTRHEIANTKIGGVDVAVTYCPLCNSAIVYERNVAGRLLTFGVSGKLYKSDLIMFDRETDSLWPQIMGESVGGDLVGTKLVRHPSQILAFSEFLERHPKGKVLLPDGGSSGYDYNPYSEYDSRDSPYGTFFSGTIRGEVPSNQRVVGVSIKDEARAYPYEDLAALGKPAVVNDELGGESIVVLWGGGARSALDDVNIDDGRVVGGSGVFKRQADGKALSFKTTKGAIVDDQTGSRWDLFGRAVAGPLKETQLEQLVHLDAFWFAWSSFVPFTDVWEG